MAQMIIYRYIFTNLPNAEVGSGPYVRILLYLRELKHWSYISTDDMDMNWLQNHGIVNKLLNLAFS